MSKSNAFETDLLNHVFNNAALANIGDATGLRASSANGNLYVSLHTSDPGEAGTQSTNETTYGSYARQPIARDGTGFTVSGDTASNTGAVAFPQCTSGTPTITHFGIGTAVSGAGHLLYSGALSASLAVSSGSTPQFNAGDMTVTED